MFLRKEQERLINSLDGRGRWGTVIGGILCVIIGILIWRLPRTETGKRIGENLSFYVIFLIIGALRLGLIFVSGGFSLWSIAIKSRWQERKNNQQVVSENQQVVSENQQVVSENQQVVLENKIKGRENGLALGGLIAILTGISIIGISIYFSDTLLRKLSLWGNIIVLGLGWLGILTILTGIILWIFYLGKRAKEEQDKKEIGTSKKWISTIIYGFIGILSLFTAKYSGLEGILLIFWIGGSLLLLRPLLENIEAKLFPLMNIIVKKYIGISLLVIITVGLWQMYGTQNEEERVLNQLAKDKAFCMSVDVPESRPVCQKLGWGNKPISHFPINNTGDINETSIGENNQTTGISNTIRDTYKPNNTNILDKFIISNILSGAYQLGSRDAKIIIIEYVDLTSQFCKNLYNDKILQTLVRTHPYDVALVIKNMPQIKIHHTSLKGAQGAYCAGKIGGGEGYYAYMNEGFKITEFTDTNVLDIAKTLNLDSIKFKSCYNEEKTKDEILTNIKEVNILFYSDVAPTTIILNKETGKFTSIGGSSYPIEKFEEAITTIIK